MRCIDRKRISSVLCSVLILSVLSGCGASHSVRRYEEKNYNTSVYMGELRAENLCVSASDVALDGYADDEQVQSAGLFDVEGQNVLYAYNLHEQIYPASITKIMTALLALENGSLDDEVTISKNADVSSFSIYAQVCGLREGEVWTLKDLLNALLIYSGNDVAVAVAEHIGGSVEHFAEMMNARAAELSAVNTHFVNPHGLHDENHYTTAYDLYLIFNECIKDERFVEIINKDVCYLKGKAADGSDKEMSFRATNLYADGSAKKPQNMTLIGGKTGTTDDYKRCLILLSRNAEEQPYISVIIGADDKNVLYRDMTELIESVQ